MRGRKLGHWPNRCPARAAAPEGETRCDLVKGHAGSHAAERGMYWIAWSAHTWTEEP